MIRDIMSGEKIPIFSCNSEFHSYNFFGNTEIFFLHLAPTLSVLAEWQQLKKKKKNWILFAQEF